MAGEPESVRVEHLGERVVGGVQAGADPAVLLGGVAGAGLAARHRLIGMGGVGEEEVDRVLGAVEERASVGLRRHPLEGVGRLAEDVRLPLALRVERHDDVAVLGERLGRVPIHLLIGLHRAVGDHDPRAPRGARPGGPDMA
jgi:hypothetical protein